MGRAQSLEYDISEPKSQIFKWWQLCNIDKYTQPLWTLVCWSVVEGAQSLFPRNVVELIEVTCIAVHYAW